MQYEFNKGLDIIIRGGYEVRVEYCASNDNYSVSSWDCGTLIAVTTSTSFNEAAKQLLGRMAVYFACSSEVSMKQGDSEASKEYKRLYDTLFEDGWRPPNGWIPEWE